MNIIDGKKVAPEIKESLKNIIGGYIERGERSPKLVIITVGNDPASKVYVKNKIKACEEVGIDCEHVVLENTASQAELNDKIKLYGEDKDTDGIIVQLPLPNGLNADYMENFPEKDVDGFTAKNLGHLLKGDFDNCFIPATPKGILTLLNRYKIKTEGKNVTIIGRSDIVGKPMAAVLMNKPYNANVTVLHSKTPDNIMKFDLSFSDIIISAIGSPKFINRNKFIEGTGAHVIMPNITIIDVGINRDKNGKLCGDVDFDDMDSLVENMTPVPGGVGPMTVASLLENTFEAYKKNIENNK